MQSGSEKVDDNLVTVPLRVTGGLVAKSLAVVILLLVLANVAAEVTLRSIDTQEYRGLTLVLSKLVLDSESNVPTWYQGASLMACALMLAGIAVIHRHQGSRETLYWSILAIAFAALSIEEVAGIHELLSVPLRRRLGLHGIFYFAWVIPGLLIALLFGAAYLRFLWRLESRTRMLFIVAGSVYLCGTLGMEMVGGVLAEESDFQSSFAERKQLLPAYLMVSTLEEALEMTGIAIFLYALVNYVGSARVRLAFEFDSKSLSPLVVVRKSPAAATLLWKLPSLNKNTGRACG